MIEAGTSTNPEAGVIATSPATAPIVAPSADGCPRWIQDMVMNVSAAIAAAVFVTTKALVAITPASGFVDVPASILIGLGVGVFVYLAMQLRPRLKVDDALDVWACHGIGGTWGAIATGLFATTAINAAGQNGLFNGNPQQALIQLVAVAATWAYAIVVTAVIVKVIDLTVGLRVREHEEALGLDASQHGEVAYQH